MSARRWWPLACACACVAHAGVAAATVPAGETIAVTSTDDEGPGTIRAALSVAQAHDSVSVPAGTYALTSAGLTVPGGVTVEGAGARSTIISGSHAHRVFEISEPGVVLADLTVTEGAALYGAGILSSAGGALSGVAVVGNVSGGPGGGVAASGEDRLDVDDSLIAGNRGTQGGGLDLAAYGGARIRSSIITGNTAMSGSGGGIALTGVGNQIILALDSDTIYGNGAMAGGGNLELTGPATTTIRNTVLGAGGAGTGAGDDCVLDATATLESLGHNARTADVNPDPKCQDSFAGTDLLVPDLGLTPLQDNGGQLDSLAPTPGSPVLDAGDPASCPAFDLRGIARPQGAACDIGAVELEVAPVVPAATPIATPSPAPAVAVTPPVVRAPTLSFKGLRAIRHGVRVTLTCSGEAGQTCSGLARLRRRGNHPVGRRSFAVAAGGHTVLKVRLGAAGRRRLAQHARLRVRLVLTGAPSRSVTLHRR